MTEKEATEMAKPKSINILGKDKNELLFSSFILAYTLYMIVTSIKGTGAIDAYPVNFLFWFFNPSAMDSS